MSIKNARERLRQAFKAAILQSLEESATTKDELNLLQSLRKR